jgi:ABC-2 type transport system ATP-binding protein
MDEGHVRAHGALREVETAYKGRDPYESMSAEALARIGAAPVLTDGRAEP